jgi:hypothetical protein
MSVSDDQTMLRLNGALLKKARKSLLMCERNRP